MYTGPVAGTAGLTVAKKATTVTYTGAKSGGPNKVVTLSATLVDAGGSPLATASRSPLGEKARAFAAGPSSDRSRAADRPLPSAP